MQRTIIYSNVGRETVHHALMQSLTLAVAVQSCSDAAVADVQCLLLQWCWLSRFLSKACDQDKHKVSAVQKSGESPCLGDHKIRAFERLDGYMLCRPAMSCMSVQPASFSQAHPRIGD